MHTLTYNELLLKRNVQYYFNNNIINVVCYLNHLHVQLSELFTYPNKFTRPVATGVRISEDIL